MATSMDVLLLHHPTSNPHRPIRVAAVGLLGMADYLRRHGLSTQVVNLAIEQSVDPAFDPVEYAAASGARLLGVSAHWFFQLPESLELARELKRRLPDVVVVLGGFAASVFAHDLIREHPQVDAVIRGDGEVPLLALAQAVTGRADRGWEGVPNLVYRGRGGSLEATAQSHVMDERLFGELRFMNLSLLKSYDACKALYYPTRAFKDRFEFDTRGAVCLAPTRGCTYECPLCGGCATVQRTAYGRRGVVFQPLDSVVADLRLALQHGYSNFYLSSDPEPNGPYYLDLFRRIRDEGLDVGCIFESWSLPSREFVDAFAATFARRMLVLSPDSADEAIRATMKGPLTYSNPQLDEMVEHIAARDVPCQLFFGFFLPGDTTESVMRTKRMVHDYEGPGCETIYLAFSTDPGTPVARDPERFGMVVEVRELRDYLSFLPRKRLSPNMLAHRPKGITEPEAQRLIAIINYDMALYKLLPRTLQLLRLLARGGEEHHRLVESALDRLAEELRSSGETRPSHLARRIGALLAAPGGDDATRTALLEVLEYEATPYSVMEEHFAGVGMHYTSSCREVRLDEAALRELRARPDTASRQQRFTIDVRAAVAALDRGQLPALTPQPSTVSFVVDRTGTFATFSPDRK